MVRVDVGLLEGEALIFWANRDLDVVHPDESEAVEIVLQVGASLFHEVRRGVEHDLGNGGGGEVTFLPEAVDIIIAQNGEAVIEMGEIHVEEEVGEVNGADEGAHLPEVEIRQGVLRIPGRVPQARIIQGRDETDRKKEKERDGKRTDHEHAEAMIGLAETVPFALNTCGVRHREAADAAVPMEQPHWHDP